jgi:YfiH family protein
MLDAQNLEGSERRAAELALVQKHTGARAVYALDQVHGTRAVRIDSASDPFPFPQADALYSSESGVCLVVRTADCMPVYFVAAGERPVSGIIHAGWRGLAAGILSKTLRAVIAEMTAAGSPPQSVDLFLGPCISGDAYEVGRDVADHFEIVIETRERPHIDLASNAELEIERLEKEHGLPMRFLRDLTACTVKDNGRYYSHRKGDRGRNLNFLYLG